MGNSNLRSVFQNYKIQDGGCDLKFYLCTATADSREIWYAGVFSDGKLEFDVGFSQFQNPRWKLWPKILYSHCLGRFA